MIIVTAIFISRTAVTLTIIVITVNTTFIMMINKVLIDVFIIENKLYLSYLPLKAGAGGVLQSHQLTLL